MCASIVGGKNPVMRSESKRRWDHFFLQKGSVHHRPIWIIYMIDLSVSIPVGTRKMVNYA